MAEDERTETLQSQHNMAKLRILHPSHEHGEARTEFPDEGGGGGEEIPDGEITIDNATVAAGSPIDTLVGTLIGRVDSGSNGVPTYELIDDSNGSFKVNGDTIETARSDLIGYVEHTITVKATVAGEGWFQNDLVITVET
jgi:hypothetical protein